MGGEDYGGGGIGVMGIFGKDGIGYGGTGSGGIGGSGIFGIGGKRTPPFNVGSFIERSGKVICVCSATVVAFL